MTCFRLKTGETLMSWCKKNNCNYKAIVNRIERGAPTVEDAIAGYLPRRGHKHNEKYFYKGQLMRKYFGNINAYQLALKRINNGTPIEQAVAEVETFYKQKAQRCAGKCKKRPVRRRKAGRGVATPDRNKNPAGGHQTAHNGTITVVLIKGKDK